MLIWPHVGHLHHVDDALRHFGSQRVKLSVLAIGQQGVDCVGDALPHTLDRLQLAGGVDIVKVTCEVADALRRVLEGDDAEAVGVNNLQTRSYAGQDVGNLAIGEALFCQAFQFTNSLSLNAGNSVALAFSENE